MNVHKIKGRLLPVGFSCPERVKPQKMTFHQYRRRVNRLTEAVKHNIPGIEKRGWYTYHIDHIFSAYKGWLSDIPVERIADLSNLRIVTREINLRKGPFGS